MKRLFKAAILIQSLLTGVYALLIIPTMAVSGFSWAAAISWILFFTAMFIFGIITTYTNHNDIFKSMDELKKERDAYRHAKRIYINAKINEIEK